MWTSDTAVSTLRGVRWLAYLHPALMIAVLALALFVLREGLRIRRARLARTAFDSRRHRRFARVLVPLVAGGALAGLLSMGWLRDRPLAESVHFPLASGAMLLIVAAGGIGLWLERGAPLRARTVHALCGAVGVLLALGAAVAGMAILP